MKNQNNEPTKPETPQATEQAAQQSQANPSAEPMKEKEPEKEPKPVKKTRRGYFVKSNILMDGELYTPGKALMLDDERATQLLEAGAIEPLKKAEA